MQIINFEILPGLFLVVTIMDFEVFNEALVTIEGCTMRLWTQRARPVIVIPSDGLDGKGGAVLQNARNGYLALLVQYSLDVRIRGGVAICRLLGSRGRNPVT